MSFAVWIGLGICAVILFVITRKMRWIVKGVAAIAFVAIAGWSLGLLFPRSLGVDGEGLGIVTPYREVVLLVAMLAGMMARMLSLAIERRRDAATGGPLPALDVDKWEFVYPTLFAVPTFSALMTQIPAGSLTPAVLALAFQNGFFWQTLLKRSASA